MPNAFKKQIRRPGEAELRILARLLELSGIEPPSGWKSTIKVKPLNDGGMGSLLLFLDGEDSEGRVFGRCVSELQFKDRDGVLVLASLNVDKNGKPYELDIWKVNFEELISYPALV